MKECFNCGKAHNSNVTIAGGWTMCSEKCKDEMEARIEKWLD